MCVSVCVYMCTMCVQVPAESDEGTGSPGTAVRGGRVWGAEKSLSDV